MKKLILAAGMVVAFAATSPAWATGSGEGACDADLARATQEFNAKSAGMTELQRHNLSQRLQIAASKCAQNNDYGQDEISMIRQALADTGSRTNTASK